MSRPGRRRYTDEPTVTTTAQFLEEPEQQMREDAAHHRYTLSSMQIELSREYKRQEVRERVLRRVRERRDEAA